jgi:ABC-type polysaccharide/polyol phosphate transport system ATPase subunit
MLPLEPSSGFKDYAIRKIQGKIQFRELWALRNVSLEIYEGEIFGVVGRNGSGKSTLLKVLSRVVYPQEGRVQIWGMVSPLLELGGGFHAELTGRENVFLNGTLLGYTKKEILEKYEEIVEFSELSDFMDAPLRTYSSGMVARLGFAVATMYRPQILLVDEILAVGDISFHKKCRERIRSFREEGTTIVLVSHSPAVVRELCQRAVWLHQGEVKMIGPVEEVVSQYESFSSSVPV